MHVNAAPAARYRQGSCGMLRKKRTGNTFRFSPVRLFCRGVAPSHLSLGLSVKKPSSLHRKHSCVKGFCLPGPGRQQIRVRQHCGLTFIYQEPDNPFISLPFAGSVGTDNND